MRRSVFAIVPRFRRPQAARKLRAGRELLGQRGEAALPPHLCEAEVATAGALLASRIRHAMILWNGNKVPKLHQAFRVQLGCSLTPPPFSMRAAGSAQTETNRDLQASSG